MYYLFLGSTYLFLKSVMYNINSSLIWISKNYISKALDFYTFYTFDVLELKLFDTTFEKFGKIEGLHNYCVCVHVCVCLSSSRFFSLLQIINFLE